MNSDIQKTIIIISAVGLCLTRVRMTGSELLSLPATGDSTDEQETAEGKTEKTVGGGAGRTFPPTDAA